MIYRLLGAVSVFVGAVFCLIALAVLIPFLNTFSGSLLILIAVFGILGWVFISIGWQLLRPPKPGESTDGTGEGVGERGIAATVNGGAAGAASANGGGAGDVDDQEIDVVFGSSFATFDVVPPGAADDVLGADEGAIYPETAGLTIDERLAADPVSFKKPYQTTPEGEDAGG